MMNSLKLNEDSCRICLLQKGKLNWNEEILLFSGISYKDCYYKYTQLDEFDSDGYPTNLCKMCANELKIAHTLFEKALESFNILRAVFSSKELETEYSDKDICRSLPAIKYENQAFDEVNIHIGDTTLIEIEHQRSSEGLEETEKEINDSEEMVIKEDVSVESAHFIDIQHLESSKEIPKLSVKNSRGKGKKYESISDTSFEQQISESCDNEELHNPSALEQNLSKSCETKSVLPRTNSKKSRDKYYLMCSYCSLKVLGADKLLKHEAIHSDNRKRTEVCPECGVKLYDKLALRQHIKTHDRNRQKNHKCEFCEKAFFNKGALNVHRRKHLGLMVKCQLCTKEYTRQNDLDRHLVKHSASPLQRNVGETKYVVQCEYCNESVRTFRYKAHVAAHLNQPQVKCKICDKNFFARRNVTNHLRRFHHKNSTEFEDFIHYYVDKKSRVSILIMKQQLSAQPLTEKL